MKKSSLNHIFRTIWSEVMNAWVAVSELVSAKGRRSGSSALKKALNASCASRPANGNDRFPLRPLALAVIFCFSAQAQANPIGAQVVNGTAAINQVGNTLTVTNSPNAIINWQGFSINPNETTNFVQQSAASSVLNRVVGSDPSQLLGTLTSNGKVFLINPSGILVGQGARIDVAGFVASTLNLSNEDFLAGRLNFGPALNAGGIQNAGSITTPEGGTVYLVAPQVENAGLIATPKGETLLAAGNTVQLIDTGTPGVTVQVTGTGNAATNLGQILADSGRIGMVAAVVKNSGTVSASSLVSQGGKIFLKASQRVEAGGTVSASGTTGGTVHVLGNEVGIMDGATVSANGAQGGGTILVGGDYQGKNPAIPNARASYVAPTAALSADAVQNGSGGKVIVWGDEATRFYGRISAKGGAQGGDGGFVETSGHYLEARGRVDLSAPQGRVGTWLLDPASIEIAGGAGDGDLAGGTASFGGTGGTTQALGQITFANGNTGPSIVYQSEIEGQSSVAHITLEATDSIFTSGTFTGSAVTLAANRNLTLRTRNQATPDLATGIDLTGSVNGVGLEFITQGTGTITIETGTGGTGPYHAAPITTGKLTSGAGITLNASGNVNINGLVKTTAGSLAVTSQTGNIATGASGSLAASSVTLNAAGNIGSAGSRLLFNTIAPNSVVVGDVIAPTALYTDMSGSIIFGAVTTNGIADFLTSGGTLTFSGNVTTNGGNVVVKSSSNLTQNAGTTINAGAGTIGILGSGFGASLNGTLTTTNAGANAVSIEGIGGDLTLGNINSSGGVVIGNGFDIRGNVTQNAGTTIAGSSVGIQAQGSVTVQTISAGAGNVGIKVIGDVVDGNGATNNVTAGQLDVLAGGGYSLNANLSGNLNIGKLYTTTGVAPNSFAAITAGDLTINGTAIGAINAGINGFTQSLNVALAINAAVPAGVTAYFTSAGTVGFATANATPVTVAFAGSANAANTGLTSPSMTPTTTSTALNLGAGTIGGAVSASNAAGDVTFSSGSLAIAGNASFTTPLVVSGGTLSLNGASSIANLTLSGGTLGGTGAISATTMNWTGGTATGSGALTVTTTLNMPAGAAANAWNYTFLDGKVLNNDGTATLGSNQNAGGNGADLRLQNGATINNNGTWNVGYANINNTGANTFNNVGALNIGQGGWGGTINTALSNSGTVSVVNDGFTLGNSMTGNGVFNSALGTTTNANGANFTVGTLSLAGALQGSAALAVTSSFNQSTGTLGNTFASANITQNAGNLAVGSMGASGAVNLTAVAGNINLAGSIASGNSISLVASGALTQSAGALLAGTSVYAEGSKVILTNANNTGVIAGKATGTAAGDIFSYTSSNAIMVTTVNGFGGILTAAPPDAVSVALSAGAAGIGQDAPIVAGGKGLSLTTTGLVGLTNPGNSVGALTATGVGSFAFNNAGALTVGVGGNGVTTTANQPISISAGGNLTVQDPVNAGSGSVNLTGSNLYLGSAAAATVSGGFVNLVVTQNNGMFSQFAGGTVSSAYGLNVVADNISLGGTMAGACSGGGGCVNIKPFTVGRTMEIAGASATAGTLSVTQAVLAAINPAATGITGGSIMFGDGTAGAIIFTGNFTSPGNMYPNLRGTTISQSPGTTINGMLDVIASGAITLTEPTNQITQLGNNFTSPSSVSVVTNVPMLTLWNTVSAGGGLSVSNSGGGITVSGTTTASTIDLKGASGIILGAASSLTASGAGNSIVLKAGAGGLVNNATAGAAALVNTGGGRWLVYAASPASVVKGGLTSNFRHYNATDASYAAPTETGNGFIYASVPGALNVDTTLLAGAASNTYGTAPTASFGYAFANAAIADNEDLALVTGTPTFTPAISSVTPAGNYTVNYSSGLASAAGYTFVPGTGLAYTVNPATLSIVASLTGTTSKVYDGTTAAILTPGNFLLSGFVGTDSATVTQTVGTYASKNAGTNVAVSATLAPADFTPGGGTNLANYVLPTTATGNIGNITPATISAVTGILANNKVYDATTAATLNTAGAAFAGMIAGDVLTVGAATGAFADPLVGALKPVSITGITLAGIDAGNYALASTTATATADITAAPVQAAAPAAPVIQQAVATTTTATTTATTNATTTTTTTAATDPAAATAPVAIDTGAIAGATTTTAASGSAATLAGPAGGTIGGTAGTFGGDAVVVATEPMPASDSSAAAPAATASAATGSSTANSSTAESSGSGGSTAEQGAATQKDDGAKQGSAANKDDPAKKDDGAGKDDTAKKDDSGKKEDAGKKDTKNEKGSKDKPNEKPEKC